MNTATLPAIQVNPDHSGHPEQHVVFACSVGCIDGRTHRPVKEKMRELYGVTYVDRVTEPGPNKILAETTLRFFWIRLVFYFLTLQRSKVLNVFTVWSIRRRVEISVRCHEAAVVAIVGHHGCSGNPNTKAKQIEHLRRAKKTIQSFGFGVAVIMLWVADGWERAEVISDLI